ncbi:phosphonate transporter [Salinisphaera hydrothermalis]|uniref:Photoactive yellow protein n=1 Tax=Salinisphaera hydrothermalis (strain C41B8) TaxID=1304275 RepID=A0A084IN96_SALHC|nr:phosphonate transporter [Salinisphaera hydrothermalis]KEZ78180.1 photoactive yellow protein [Salinisphaera hydrothermalis C41B8]
MSDTQPTFETIQLSDLENMAPEDRDALEFGVIGLRPDTRADVYNATEANMAGVDPAQVLGAPFFSTIGQCMNNFMVAQRFEDEPDLDDIVPFVLTLRMRPTRVRLRLLQARDTERRYILVER